MKKGLKALLGILIPIIIILVVYVILIIKQIVPNPFLDTSDLLCRRDNPEDREEFYFEFNWLGKVKNARKISYIYFESEEELNSHYDYYASQNIENIKKDGTTIIIENYILDNQIDLNETRKSLNNNYNEFGFECK